MWVKESRIPSTSYEKVMGPSTSYLLTETILSKFGELQPKYEEWGGAGEVCLPQIEKKISPSLIKHALRLRIRSFCRLGIFSSLIFLGTGIYLIHVGSLPFEIGGPLATLFGMLLFVFLWRKP